MSHTKILLVVADNDVQWKAILSNHGIRIRNECKVYVLRSLNETREKSRGLPQKSTRFVVIGDPVPWKQQASEELGFWHTKQTLAEALTWLQGASGQE